MLLLVGHVLQVTQKSVSIAARLLPVHPAEQSHLQRDQRNVMHTNDIIESCCKGAPWSRLPRVDPGADDAADVC